jgi:hypothetical protein
VTEIAFSDCPKSKTGIGSTGGGGCEIAIEGYVAHINKLTVDANQRDRQYSKHLIAFSRFMVYSSLTSTV